MYLSYYGLERKPFQVNTDPKFLWLGEKHKDALAMMTYGVLYDYGYILVTGDVGTGKTTLVNALIQDLGDEIVLAKINDPGLETLDFFNLVARAYGIRAGHVKKSTFLTAFHKFLHKCHLDRKKVVLIIDEAQRLSRALLEDIRHLSNIEEEVLTIVFVGQTEFNEMLLDDRNRALRQRIGMNYNIEPLSEAETREYILHRLKTAGVAKKIFDVNAIREVFLFSAGIPRLINIVCDRALLNGFVNQRKLIGAEIIEECAEELQLPGENVRIDSEEIGDHRVIASDEVKRRAQKRAERRAFVSPAAYVAPVLALLAVFAAYLHDPRIASKILQGMKLQEVRSLEAVGEIGGEFPRSRPQKTVSEIVTSRGSRDDTKVTRSDVREGRETGLEIPEEPFEPSSGDNTSRTEKKSVSLPSTSTSTRLEARPVGATNAWRGSTRSEEPDSTTSEVSETPETDASVDAGSSEGGLLSEESDGPMPIKAANSDETHSNQQADVVKSSQDVTLKEKPGTPDPGDVIDWLLTKRTKN